MSCDLPYADTEWVICCVSRAQVKTTGVDTEATNSADLQREDGPAGASVGVSPVVWRI